MVAIDKKNCGGLSKDNYSIAVLSYHPVQYHSAFYRALHNCSLLRSKVYHLDDLSLKKFYCDEFSTNIKWDVPLLDGYEYQFLRNFTWNKENILIKRFNPGVVTVLLSHDYDAVLVTGYDTLTAFMALAAAKLTGKKVLFRTEADLGNPTARWRKSIKKILLTKFFGLCDAILYSCERNREYFKHFGVPDSKLFPILCSVDNVYFQAKRINYEKEGKDAVRERLGIPKDSVVVLYVGRLTDRKRPYDLLKAFIALGDINKNATLVIVGDGPLRDSLESKINAVKADNIILTGFKNLSETPKYYAAADIFVLPSQYDPTPKVVNEAMNFSLPVIVSTGVGTANDLIQHDVNGLVFDIGDTKTLSICLKILIASAETRLRMGRVALKIVSGWSPEQNVSGVLQALEYCFSCNKKS